MKVQKTLDNYDGMIISNMEWILNIIEFPLLIMVRMTTWTKLNKNFCYNESNKPSILKVLIYLTLLRPFIDMNDFQRVKQICNC